jgi:hypothetical protein
MIDNDKNDNKNEYKAINEVFYEQYSKILNDFLDIFKEKTLSKDSFLTISELEKLWKDLNGQVAILHTKLLETVLEQANEADLIHEKKKEYRDKGILLRTNRRVSLTILTINGPLTFYRYVLRPKTYIDCKKLMDLEGVKVIIPLDIYLGISNLPFKMTLDTMLNVAHLAQSRFSFVEAANDCKTYLGLSITYETVRQVAITVGDIIFKNDCKKADDLNNLRIKGKLNFPSKKKQGILYIQADGAALNTREKDEKGSTWRENKLGLVFSSDNIKYRIDSKGKQQHTILKREYVAYVGNVETFQKLLFQCAIRNGYGTFTETVLISDGATWIRNMKEMLFPDSQQILDFFHLCEKVSNFAKNIFNNDENKYKPWSKNICDALKEGKYIDVIKIINNIEYDIVSKSTINLVQYIENNINNIDYANYIKKGYFIGSGAIESGNKSVLQQRLKQAGMRWNIPSAQSMLILKSKSKSFLWSEDVKDVLLNHYKSISKPNSPISSDL